MATTPAEVSDGRHQRSEKNREAIVHAALALIRETGRQPTAEEVAERGPIPAYGLPAVRGHGVAARGRRWGRTEEPKERSASLPILRSSRRSATVR